MKGIFKAISKVALTVMLSCAMLMCVSTTAMAAGVEGYDTEGQVYETGDIGLEAEGSDTEDQAYESGDGLEAEGADAEDPTSDTDGVGADAEEENFFTIIYNAVMERAGEIFSTLAFISSLIIAIAYKKGLIPALAKAVAGIEAAIEKAKARADESEGTLIESCDGLRERLGGVENTLSLIEESLIEAETRLGELTSEAAEREKMRTIMSTQIDLLYNIFMSSSLPQYQKDAIGNKVAEMKEKMAE